MQLHHPALTIVVLLGLWSLGGGAGWAAPAGSSGDEVSQLVEDLSHEDYARREAATVRLGEMGQSALGGVLAAAMSDDPEATKRAEQILVGFADSFEPDLFDAMQSEVGERRSSSDPRVAQRAEALFAMMTSAARNRSALYLSGLGLTIRPDAEAVTSVRLGDEWRGADQDLRHLIRFPELVTVNLSRSERITDEAMKILPRLPNLEKLYIGSTSITGSGLAHLKEMPALKYISLQYLKIDDADAEHVAPLVSLEHLGFDYTKISDEGLKHVVHLKELQTLWLNAAEIDGPGLLHLKDLPKLKKLVLAKAPFDDEGMEFLGQLSQLEHLGLDGTKITDEGARHFESLGGLKKLWVNQTELGDDAIPSLAKLTALEQLYIPECKFTEEGIAKLRELLPGCEITTE